jgi:hypothetical protein
MCDSNSRSSCDLQIWPNYRNPNSFNRVVVKQCSSNKDGDDNGCNGCSQAFKKNPSFTTNTVLIWNINVNMESKNLNYKQENYIIDILSNLNSSMHRPFFNNVQFPTISVTFDYYNRPLYNSARCNNDPHCLTFDQRYNPFEFYFNFNF